MAAPLDKADLQSIAESLDSAIDGLSAAGKSLDTASKSDGKALDAITDKLDGISDSLSALSLPSADSSDFSDFSLDSVLSSQDLGDVLSIFPEIAALGMGIGFLVALLGMFFRFMHRVFSVDDID